MRSFLRQLGIQSGVHRRTLSTRGDQVKDTIDRSLCVGINGGHQLIIDSNDGRRRISSATYVGERRG
jgi:hypothetical protein